MKILIATDGSDFSTKAIETACRTLRPGRNSQIRLISIYEPSLPMATEPFALSAPYYQELSDTARKQCVTNTSSAVEQLRKCLADEPVAIETEVRMGPPARVIVDEAKDWDADVIVVGSHGRGFWGRLTLGSVSDAIIHHAPCSVLVAR